MTFQIFWFILIAVLWTGFFVLEGFDFGVGMLKGVVGRTDEERRVALNTIGPLWDGNEVWLIVAGAGMFAAFPEWYATMFSAFYLALVLLLVALIVRGVSFEYRGKRDSERWRGGWDLVSGIGSLVAPLLIGIALGDLLVGLPIDSSFEYTGSFWNLLTPYGVFTGITLTLLCVLHGATFLSLKATGEVRERSGVTARRAAPPVALVVLAWFLWTQITINEGVIPGLIPVSSVLAVIAVVWLLRDHREGWAFAMTTFAIACTVLSIFIDLYPRVMVSSTSASNSLTVQNAAAGAYSLKVMTVVAIALPAPGAAVPGVDVLRVPPPRVGHGPRGRLGDDAAGHGGGRDPGSGELLRPIRRGRCGRSTGGCCAARARPGSPSRSTPSSASWPRSWSWPRPFCSRTSFRPRSAAEIWPPSAPRSCCLPPPSARAPPWPVRSRRRGGVRALGS